MKKKITIRYSLFLLVFFKISLACAEQHWGDFKADQCSKMGHRQYSSILWEIPLGTSWEEACKNMPATINGKHYDKPNRCVNTNVNMWGEFDVADEQCPHWGEFKRDSCKRPGFRQYSAILWNIPPNTEWKEACSNMPATINGNHYDKPSRCVNTNANMWGEFDVEDNETCGIDESFFVSHMNMSNSGYSEQCLKDTIRTNNQYWATDGCSVPLVDDTTRKYQDVLYQSCMLHDYCYTMPPTKPNLKAFCDDVFRSAMKSQCKEDYLCRNAADTWWVAVRVGADSAFKNAQNNRATYPIESCNKP